MDTEAHTNRAPGSDRGREALDALLASIERETDLRQGSGERRLPAAGARRGGPRIGAVHELVEQVRRLVFVGFFERKGPEPGGAEALRAHIGLIASRSHDLVAEHARAELGEGREAEAHEIAARFMADLASLRETLARDVRAAYEGDPAARSLDEVILCYPGVDAVFSHRVAHRLWTLGAQMTARIVAELAHSRTGIDIHPGATIGSSFFIDHGTGVVIGETAIIGDDVKMYQGVTLGAKSFERDERGRLVRGVKRHPTIGSRVTIYADAVILGGDTLIGDDCVVNGGVFLTQSVPPGHIVRAKQPDLAMRENRERRGG